MRNLILYASVLILLFSCSEEKDSENRFKASKNKTEKEVKTPKVVEKIEATVADIKSGRKDLIGNIAVVNAFFIARRTRVTQMQATSPRFFSHITDRKHQYDIQPPSVYINKEEGSNTVKIPESMLTEDLIFTDKNGNTFGLLEPVKLELKIKGNTQNYDLVSMQFLDNYKADYPSMDPVKVTGENVLNDSLFSWGRLAVVEGSIKVPESLYAGRTHQSFDLLNTGFEEVSNIKSYFKLGNAPNLMKPIGRVYTKKSITIKDNKGRKVNVNRKLRLYGTLHGNAFYVERIEQL